MTEINIVDQLNIETVSFAFFDSNIHITEDLKKQLQPVLDVGDFKAKLNEITFCYVNTTNNLKRVILVGLGKKEKITAEKVRRVFGALGSKAREKNIENLALDLSALKDLPQEYVEASIEGVLLGNYRFETLRTDEKFLRKKFKQVSLFSNFDLKPALLYAKATILGTNLSRELGNLPSNIATPTYLADQSKDLEKLGIKITILEKEEIIKEKMGLFEAVFRGSANVDPPKFIIMEYEPETYDKTLVLVGKAITFDTGGVSLKPVANMGEMISDMCGGASVIGAMKTIGMLKPNIKVIGLVPSTPNVLDGASYRPGDIITSRSGKTVEVISTDAEGRMLLADTLDYAKKYNPDLVLNFATLTGAIIPGLGYDNAAYYVNEKSENFKEMVFKAGRISGDYLWQMPLDQDYKQQIKSKFGADLRQTGGKPAGSITAAIFLSQFVDYPWIHFDIAGTAFLTVPRKPLNYNSQPGATGFGVRFISQFIRDWVSK